MKQFKEAQVIMLPTKNKSSFGLVYFLNKLYKYTGVYNPFSINDNWIFAHHLYIISDDEIKEGDYWINLDNNVINSNIGIANFANNAPSCKKIIATTDTSLKIEISTTGITDGGRSRTFYSSILLPQPSQQFITIYIEFYNKGEVITDVLVEYENENIKLNNGYNNFEVVPYFSSNKLKVNPKDNTITIKPIKDSWNREEVINLLIKRDIHLDESDFPNKLRIEKWIEENL